MKVQLWGGLSFVVLLLQGVAGMADSPEVTRTSSHDWECTYAFSDTTCREMISAWAEDEGLDSANVADFMRCSDCQRRELVGAYSKRYLIGYECNNRAGYDRRFASLDDVIGVYREAKNRNEGWRVTGWNFHRCLLSWRCAQACAIDFNHATCVPLRGYYIGRWLPEMGRQCDERVTEKDAVDIPSGSGSSGDRQTHWHGFEGVPTSDP